jgi:hypothetical protein
MALTQISTKGIKDGTITNADINANAAIAGTKIDTDFGNQNLVTTGSIHATNLDISGITTNNSMDIMFSINNDGSARTVAVDSTAGKFSYNPSENRLFVDNINMPDSGVLNIGSGTGTAGDLQIFHDGFNSFINEVGTGGLFVRCQNTFNLQKAGTSDFMIKATTDGNVELYSAASKKFQTDTHGITVFRDTGDAYTIIRALENSSSADAAIRLSVSNDSARSMIQFGDSSDDDVGNIMYQHNDERMRFYVGTADQFEANTDGIQLDDSKKAQFGNSNDLQIYHDGTTNYLRTENGSINIIKSNTENIAKFIPDGAVELYHNNSKKLETASYGTFTSGTVALSGDVDIANDTGKIKLGTNADIKIFHNGTDSIIDNTSGELQITTDAVMRFNATEYKFNNAANNEKIANFFQDGACELYFDHSKKFQTGHGGEYGSFQALNGNNGWDGMAVGNSKFVFMGSNSDEAVGIWNDQDNEWMVKCIRNAETQLQHNGQLKLETTTTGISVTGRADLSDKLIIDSNSPQIRLDEADTTTSTRLLMSGGQFYLQTAASGQGTSTSAGVLNLTGYNNTTASQINLKASTTIAHGDLRPSATNSFDLGTSSIRWRNLYTNDLHLSNEGGKNDVDGTYGSYTIQEGAEDLFLINRRNGKKYKFNLTEVS